MLETAIANQLVNQNYINFLKNRQRFSERPNRYELNGLLFFVLVRQNNHITIMKFQYVNIKQTSMKNC